MWKCPKCNREFAKENQSHSCVIYPLEEHFRNKENQRKFFDKYIDFVRKNVGDFKIEAMPCCIHLVGTYTFSAVWILKNKMRIDFMLPDKLSNARIIKIAQPSTNRYVHYLEVVDERDFDDELANWLKKAYFLKS